jgi:hypothetical protein
MRAMRAADFLAGKFGLAWRLPDRIDDLRGPAGGVVLLPRNLALPGMRECDIGEDAARRAMYSLLLTQGSHDDIVRLVNPRLLSRDWPALRKALDPRLSRKCERLLGLGQRIAGPGGRAIA